MPAIDVRASIFCARDSWRGNASIASTVALRSASRCISSAFCAGQMKPISVPPSRTSGTSSGLGARTLNTMSDTDQISAAVGSTTAPAAR